MVVARAAGGRGCTIFIQSCCTSLNPSHSYNAGTEHAGASPTRQALRAPSGRRPGGAKGSLIESDAVCFDAARETSSTYINVYSIDRSNKKVDWLCAPTVHFVRVLLRNTVRHHVLDTITSGNSHKHVMPGTSYWVTGMILYVLVCDCGYRCQFGKSESTDTLIYDTQATAATPITTMQRSSTTDDRGTTKHIRPALSTALQHW